MVEAVAREPEMVRRVAEAMFEGYRKFINDTLGPDRAPIPWAELDGTSMRCYCAAAREGIQAMREPTDAMADAGRWPGEDGEPKEAWRLMIDAALAVPEEGREP
jgi:hypothetical protein